MADRSTFEPDTFFPDGDSKAPRFQARRVVSFWLASTAALAYLTRNSISVVELELRQETGLSEEMMGWIMGPAFFWSYALFQIPGGWLGQKYGARLFLSVFTALSSVAAILFAGAQGGAMLLVGRLTGGAAQAGLFPCATLAISRWFPRDERGVASGILGASMSVGGAVGAALTGTLVAVISWRWAFVLYAAPGFLWAWWFYRWFRETPAEHPAVSAQELQRIEASAHAGPTPKGAAKGDAKGELKEGATGAAGGTPWRALFSNSALWLVCGQQFFRAAGYGFFASWFATYLKETRGVSTAASGWLTAIPLLATIGGSLTGGHVSDWVLRRTGSLRWSRSGVGGFSLLACGLLAVVAYYTSDAMTATAIIGLGAYCAAMAGPCAYSVTIDIGGRHVASVFGAMNMIGNFGAGLLPIAVPLFRQWVERSPEILEFAGGNSWNAIIMLFAVIYFLGAACWMFLRYESAPS